MHSSSHLTRTRYKSRMPRSHRTAEQVLDVAQALIQSHGYNGFSYADVARALSIRKASIHHHFATKAELGRALMARYRKRFSEALASIDAGTRSAPAKLRKYAGLFRSVLEKGHRMCLCGMLAADYSTLPPMLGQSIREFFADNETWLEAVLVRGKQEGSLAFDGPARAVAARILASLEGGMLVARSFEDPARFNRLAASVLDGLRAA